MAARSASTQPPTGVDLEVRGGLGGRVGGRRWAELTEDSVCRRHVCLDGSNWRGRVQASSGQNLLTLIVSCPTRRIARLLHAYRFTFIC